MFSRASGIVIQGGTFNGQTSRTSGGMDILKEQVAPGALHNSNELYDAPKCHPHTRIAVLDEIMHWINESEDERKDYILWLFGSAGAGKSAIAKRIAELAVEKGLLISSFFFSRTVSTRNTKDHLIATLAYQLALSIPDTRTHIEDAVERDPIIFKKDLQTQIDTLLVEPLYLSSSTNTTVPSQKLIIIDGVDECKEVEAQVDILNTMAKTLQEHDLPLIFLIASRPEQHISIAFNTDEPLKSIHRRLALDAKYQPDSDIRLFLSDKFERIKRTHPLRPSIPTSWPMLNSLNTLVQKSSGQFIYAATVIRFVESIRHRPTAQLDIVLGMSPPRSENPFAQLDALYHHILSRVVDIPLTLRVLSVYIADPPISSYITSSELVEQFLSLGQDDIQLALVDLPSIVSYETGVVTILHASLVDFLLDKRRSTIFHIDMAVTNSDLAHCILRSYDLRADCASESPFPILQFKRWLVHVCKHTFMSPELRNDFLNFDVGAYFRKAKETGAIKTRDILFYVDKWMGIVCIAGLEDRDKQAVLNRCIVYLKSQLQLYQSDCRLQLLVILMVFCRQDESVIMSCRTKDILLGLDEHSLHLLDLNALDLRHALWPATDHFEPRKSAFHEFRLNGDGYASLALQCLRCLAEPSKYLGSYHILDSGAEWSSIIFSYDFLLCFLLPEADTIPELLQFIANNDFHPTVKKKISACFLWGTILHILAFLSRADLCINWWIVSAIQLTPVAFSEASGPNPRAQLAEIMPFWGLGVCSANDPCCPGDSEDPGWDSD